MPHTTSTFFCSYCNKNHPMEWNTDEHIIPKALKNENYILKNTCRKLNNYMSHSFEKKVLQFDIIKLIMLLIDPPAKPTYLTEVKTNLDKEAYIYILPSGKMELTEHPIYEQHNAIEIKIIDINNEIHIYNLILPFTFKSGMIGIPRMVTERKRVIEQERNKINKYLKELSNNPEINEPFFEFLKNVKGQYIFKPIIISENEPTEHPPVVLSENPKKTIVIDNESLYKLFLKIAWTHARNQFGAEKLSNPITNYILKYLTTGNIIDNKLIKETPNLFTKPIKIENEDYIFWKYGIDDTFDKIQQIQNEISKSDLMEYHIERYQQFNIIQQFIFFNYVKRFDLEFMETINKEHRFHNISLRTEEFAGQYVTVCHMQLFGGIFDVVVKLSDSPLMVAYPKDIKIEF